MNQISRTVETLARRHRTRDPFAICDALGVRVRLKDLGTGLKAYYFCQSRIRSIVINWRVSEEMRRVLAAHELGHDRLHRDIAMIRGFQDTGLFDLAAPAEREANIFAAELLIGDRELIELLGAGGTVSGAARTLCVPEELVDFKLRALGGRGHALKAPGSAPGDFLRKDPEGCFDGDG